jgi:SAM-dependent methyltransferase
VCSTDQTDAVYASLLRCRSCSHVWADIALDWSALRRIYQRSYFFGDEYGDYLGDRRAIEKNFGKRLATLRRYLKPSHRRLFEIGCAYGLFLNIARGSFETVEGIDISEDAVAYATGTLGVNAICGDVLKTDLASRAFDVVCMWDTIEHLADPRRYVEAAASRVAPGGLVAITTGDIGSLNARVRKGRWRLIHPPTHLQYFTRRSLSELLERCGFRTIHTEYCGFYRSVAGIVHNMVALGWERPALAASLRRVVPDGLDLYLNLGDIMFMIAERR